MSNWQDAEDEAAEELSFRSEPSRKPMTDEEIEKCFPPDYEPGPFAMRRWIFALVRAIEKHHKIGTEK